MCIRDRYNNAMHAKSGLHVVLKWKIYRPDSVIAAVIPTKAYMLKHRLIVIAIHLVSFFAVYSALTWFNVSSLPRLVITVVISSTLAAIPEPPNSPDAN